MMGLRKRNKMDSKQLSISTLKKLMEDQLVYSIKQQDSSQVETLNRIHEEEELALKETKQNIDALALDADLFARNILAKTDEEATAWILEAYGTYGK